MLSEMATAAGNAPGAGDEQSVFKTQFKLMDDITQGILPYDLEI